VSTAGGYFCIDGDMAHAKAQRQCLRQAGEKNALLGVLGGLSVAGERKNTKISLTQRRKELACGKVQNIDAIGLEALVNESNQPNQLNQSNELNQQTN